MKENRIREKISLDPSDEFCDRYPNNSLISVIISRSSHREKKVCDVSGQHVAVIKNVIHLRMALMVTAASQNGARSQNDVQ